MANKIKFGLKNVYYAKMTETTQGETYASPVAMPGAVNLSLSAEGGIEPFYADNDVYYQAVTNSGYTGDLELALVPDSFRTDILGERTDTNGLHVESKEVETTYFALLFEFNGDNAARRHVMYKCSAKRPEVASNTTQDTKTPVTEKINITAIPNKAGYVKAFVDTSSSKYTSWFTTVASPAFTS